MFEGRVQRELELLLRASQPEVRLPVHEGRPGEYELVDLRHARRVSATACRTRSTPTTRRPGSKNRIATRRSTSRTSGRRSRRLTLNLGLRLDTNYGWQPATCQVTTQFLAGAVLAGERTASPISRRWRRALLVVYDLFGDGKTALKVSRQPLQPADWDEPGRAREPERRVVRRRRSDERHQSLDGLQGRSDVGLRSQRRPPAAAERAGAVERIQFRQHQPLQQRPAVAGRERVHGSSSSGSCPATWSRRSATRGARRGATSARGTSPCR